MNYRALATYYGHVTFYNLCFAIVIGFIFSAFWAVLLFATLGNSIGFLAFGFFQKDEYYLYQNLGFTKLRLWVMVGLVNLSLMVIPLILSSI